MRHRGEGAGLLIAIGLLIGFSYYGRQAAEHFRDTFVDVLVTLAPILGPIAAVALGVVLFRYYWSRW